MNDTLATLIAEVQYEITQVASPAVGQTFREHIKARINREYRRLYNDFDWPDLIEWSDKPLAAGQRYYDWPTGVSLPTTQIIWRRWGNEWLPIERGITPEHYNAFDSDDDVRSDPVQAWRPKGREQIEVWPIPAGSGQTLRFVAKRAFTPLVEESDICDLDTDLIVLHASAQLARKYDSDEANLILARAKQHYDVLKSRNGRGATKVNFAAGAPRPAGQGFRDKTIVGVVAG
jgi:hypothetical protein